MLFAELANVLFNLVTAALVAYISKNLKSIFVDLRKLRRGFEADTEE